MTNDQKQVPGRTTIFTYAILLTTFVALVMAKESGWMQSSDVKRYIGIVMALMLAVTGNFLPKLLHPDRTIAGSQRRSGWGLVLTGAILIVALLAAPADQIELWSGIVGLGGMSIILIDVISRRTSEAGQGRAKHDQSTVEKKHAETRVSALLIVHAIGWVFAMFLADYLWGDAAAKWLLLPFTILNIMFSIPLVSAFIARSRT